MSKRKSPGALQRVGAVKENRIPGQPREHDYSTPQKKSCQVKRGSRASMEETRIQKPGYWAVLPATVRYDQQLPEGAKVLYAEISSLTYETGYCFASNEYFRKLYRWSERTVQRHLKALESGGYIRIEDGDGGAGRRRIYAGINPLAQNPDKNDGVQVGTPTKLSPNPDKIVTRNSKENNMSPHKAPQGAQRAEVSDGCSPGLTAGMNGKAPGGKRAKKEPMLQPSWKPERFEGFWSYYPIHTSKQAAMRAWDRLKPGDELIADIGKALRRQKESDLWLRGVGIPYASTYLNQRRWEDGNAEPLPSLAEPEEAEVWL